MSSANTPCPRRHRHRGAADRRHARNVHGAQRLDVRSCRLADAERKRTRQRPDLRPLRRHLRAPDQATHSRCKPQGGAFSVSLSAGDDRWRAAQRDPLPRTGRQGRSSRVAFPEKRPAWMQTAYLFPAPPGVAIGSRAVLASRQFPSAIGRHRRTACPQARRCGRGRLRGSHCNHVRQQGHRSAAAARRHARALSPAHGSWRRARASPSLRFARPTTRPIHSSRSTLQRLQCFDSAWRRSYTMWQNYRGALGTPDGRTLFNFAVSDGIDPAISLAGREIYVRRMGERRRSQRVHVRRCGRRPRRTGAAPEARQQVQAGKDPNVRCRRH